MNLKLEAQLKRTDEGRDWDYAEFAVEFPFDDWTLRYDWGGFGQKSVPRIYLDKETGWLKIGLRRPK